ncbi:AAA family ATPase [Actinacidiphila sp. ITFR-21]|uniref:AAA family ATPase n=1 Tax=Actinacidiphila sp. ITFR-21 TaxID=3075199 RepID=UPI002888FD2A|nr:ATP-binding protein [Streptomyces sp. ITFR-21]WNI17040.1 ATP-binding protein [Streptomyces sp. ITFR-21]
MKLHRESEDAVLLRFRVTNHKSIRDTAELVLTTADFDAIRPKDGDWDSVTNRIAGLFGANASGKTTVLEAMAFAVNAINRSATWSSREEFPHHPFMLDDHSKTETSAYEFDFTDGGIRHVYGFEIDSAGVASEWLSAFPEGRRRVLFDRAGPAPEEITFSRNLKGENVRISRLMAGRNLYLSVAAMANHPYLRRIHYYLTRHVRYAAFSEFNQHGRIQAVKKWIENQEVLAEAQSLLRFADLGISRISLDRVDIDENTESAMRRTMRALLDDGEDEEERFADFLERQRNVISFWHEGGSHAGAQKLDISDESSGTVAWLSLALPALREIRSGGVLLVDELDASLHPRLASALISLFKSPEINTRGAQMIFTSHDTSLMGHLSGDSLEPEDVWFSEKADDGSTGIYPLTDFPVKKDQNIERRYLGGRYGAVPAIAWEELRSTLAEVSA